MKTQKKELQKGVDYIGVTCVFYCHDGKGNLLLHKRSDNCRDEKGRWDCGGGSLEFGETFEDAVRREVREEYCASISRLQFVGVNNVIRKNEGMITHWIAVIFAVEIKNKKNVKIGEPDKMDDIGWFAINQLPHPRHSMLLTHLKMVQEAGILS